MQLFPEPHKGKRYKAKLSPTQAAAAIAVYNEKGAANINAPTREKRGSVADLPLFAKDDQQRLF